MGRKKIISIILSAVIIVTAGFIVSKNTDILKYINYSKTESNIKLTNYKPAKKVNNSGFQIDKYDRTNITGLINDNEVLTLTYKDMPRETAVISDTSQYCSIYNLNTKAKKDFKDVNISLFYGLSPDKKYALYMEPAFLSKSTPEETKKAQQRGKLYRGLKILNLFTGKVNTLILDHSNGEFKWISNDKVWASFFTGWQIIGVDGKIYASGDYDVTGNIGAWTVGQDIKDLGNTVEGKIYYTKEENKPVNISLKSMDIKTKEIKPLFYSTNSLRASKQGNTIAMDHHIDHGEISPGIYNRTFETIILDSNGQMKRNISTNNYAFSDNFVLSPDGTKAAYIDQDNSKNTTPNTAFDLNNIQSTLKIIDIKTGDSKEIIKCPYITNVLWSSLGDSLSFNSERPITIKHDDNKPYSIDDLKNFQDYKNTILNKNKNISSYVVTFDK
ncbi:hypothetical protein OSC52_16015 [Clostridium pasteurianum]|uniref:hypothetical protein n=1 Tax=Clostridium pasteurianum TaxID=1501 RepID=UPI0022608156|nr:hypothetical protein [Clostridium pasteurianum]UZW13341.1 hypothetical protein OSC52_16015 [Clostridium pasteurianum]